MSLVGREAVPISEGPLSEVPLCNASVVNSWNYRVVTRQVPLD